MSDRWRGVLAALLNDDLRAVLAETSANTSLSPARRERAVSRLEQIGLVRPTADGVVFDDRMLRALLAEDAPAAGVGPVRFLGPDGRIDRYPLRAADRTELLTWIADRAFDDDALLSESDVNTRLESYAPGGDVAALRRHLVDHQLLERTRSGSQYGRVKPPAARA